MYEYLKDPVFLNELSKLIGHDWKILGRYLSISENDLEIIDYTNEKVRTKAYAMLTKFIKASISFKDIRNALTNMRRLDLVNEIDQFTRKLERDNTSSTGGLECDNAKSYGKLEKDNAVEKQPLLQSRSEIENLFKTGVDAILSFNANDKKIDTGVNILNNVINRITSELNHKTDEDFLKMLRSSYEIIGDIYTSNFRSKFQGNNYVNKTPEKYKIAIDAYEKCLEYSRYLCNSFGYCYEPILNKLVDKLDKPTNYGYDLSVRDSSKYEHYYKQYVSVNLYERGKSCLQNKDYKNAVHFFECEINQPCCLDTQGSSFMHVAMILHYYDDKTKQSFDKSVEYYNKAINVFLNKDEIDCGSELTDCLYHLYALLSNPSVYKFDSLLANEIKAKEIYNAKEQYINNNAERLYIQAKIFACKRFTWMNDRSENLDPGKVLEYCTKALKASNISVVNKTKIHFLMAYTYSSLMAQKDLDCYQKAISSCREALMTYLNHSNQGYAERVVTESITLAYLPENREFQNITAADMKPLRDLLEEIYKAKDYKINGFKDMLDSYKRLNIQLIHTRDPFLLDRQNKLFKDLINNKSVANSKEYKDRIEKEEEHFNTTKKRLAEIEKISRLYWYYSAFQKTLSHSYQAAVLVKSGQVVIDPKNISIKLASIIFGIAPFIPKAVADLVPKALKALESADMINAAKNLTHLAVNQTQFDNMIMDIIVNIIFENQKIFLAKDSEKDAMTWYNELIKLCKTIFEKVDGKIYGEEYPEVMHKLGNKDATKIISKWVSNGKIYGETNGASLLPKEKKHRLKNIVHNETMNVDVTDVADTTNDVVKSFDSENSKENKPCCWCCCKIFCCCKKNVR